MIDKLIRNIGFKPTNHEPCLYGWTYNDQPIFLLRQVDDFLLSAPSLDDANKIFGFIQKGLKQDMKYIGIVTMFNGLDIDQTQGFIKLSCHTYLSKILTSKNWIATSPNDSHSLTIPMKPTADVIKNLETETGPTDVIEQKSLATEMGFSYR